MKVKLSYLKMNGQRRKQKAFVFDEKQIQKLIERLNNRKGLYYCDKGIWDAICRVERGKVTNKIRFSIYSRDNYRCKICGTKGNRFNELEIDHIKPIAKGGKSTYDNLQTLCHRCNVKKGSNYKG